MTLQSSSQAQLRQYVEQIERLIEEQAALAADVSDIYKEAKAQGFDPKIMRKVIALRKKSRSERNEEEALLDVYLAAVEGRRSGDDTPLGGVWADGDEARA